MNRTGAMAVAFVAASLAPGVAITVYVLLTKLISGHFGLQSLQGALAINLAIWIVSTAHVVVLGMPIVYVLNKFHRLNGWTVSLAGFVGGMVPVGIITGLSSRSLVMWLSSLKGVTMLGTLGLIAALTFWMVWRQLDKPPRSGRMAVPPMLVPADTNTKSP